MVSSSSRLLLLLYQPTISTPLGRYTLQTLNRVCGALFQRDPINAQDIGGARVIEPDRATRGEVSPRRPPDVLRRQLARELRERSPHRLQYPPVVVVPRRREEPLAARLRPLHRLDVRERRVPHVHPQEHARRRDLLLPFSLQQLREPAVARVDGGQRVQVVGDGAEDEGRADGGEVEARLLGRDEVPRGLLGELLGHPVRGGGGARDAVLVRARVPVGLGEGAVRVREVGLGEDGGEGAGDDDALHRGRVLGDGAQHRGGPVDGGLEQLRARVRPVVVERRGCVLHVVEIRVASDDAVEGVRRPDVRHDGHCQLRAGILGADGRGLGFRAHGRYDFVAPL